MPGQLYPVYAYYPGAGEGSYALKGYADTVDGAEELIALLRRENEDPTVSDFVAGDPIEDLTEFVDI